MTCGEGRIHEYDKNFSDECGGTEEGKRCERRRGGDSGITRETKGKNLTILSLLLECAFGHLNPCHACLQAVTLVSLSVK